MRLRILILAALLVGCDEDSPDVTGVLDAKYEVSQSSDNQIDIKAQFEKSGWNAGAQARLSDSDRVYVGKSGFISDLHTSQSAFDAEKRIEQNFVSLTRKTTPSETPAFWSAIKDNRTLFEAKVDADPDWQSFSFALLRTFDHSADGSAVTLPSTFTLLTPTEGTTLSRRNDDLLIEWNNLLEDIDELYVRVLVDCGFNNTEEYDESSNTDIGYLIIPAATLSQNVKLEGNCDTEITVIKRNEGALDPKFPEGYITAVQVRTVNITTSD